MATVFPDTPDVKANERIIEWAKANESFRGEKQDSDDEGGQWGCHYCRLSFSNSVPFGYLIVGEIICRECYVIGRHIDLDE